MAQLRLLCERFEIGAVKIGIVQHLDLLKEMILLIQERFSNIPIVWDPVIKSSTGFEFLKINPAEVSFTNILSEITHNFVLYFSLKRH